jgi:hypothetical protein
MIKLLVAAIRGTKIAKNYDHPYPVLSPERESDTSMRSMD